MQINDVLHRRHVRRGVPDARGADRDHREECQVGTRGGPQAHGLRHVGDRMQVRSGDRATSLPKAKHLMGGPALSVLFFAMDAESLRQAADRARWADGAHLSDDQLLRRARHRAETDWPSERRCGYSGTGFKASKVVGEVAIGACPSWRGSSSSQETFGMQKAVGGGNFLILGEDADARARGRGGGCRRDRSAAGSDHAFSGRRGAQRKQSGLETLQEHDRNDQRRVRADPSRHHGDQRSPKA